MGNPPKKTKRVPVPKLSSPAHRYSKVLDFINLPDFEQEKDTPNSFSKAQDSLVEMCRGSNKPLPNCVSSAYLIYSIPTSKSILEGLLISEETPEVIASITGTTTSCIEYYSDLFFDTEVFYNRLMVVAYIRGLPANTPTETFHKQIISWGYYLGSSYIAWKIGAKGSIIEKSPEESVAEVLTDATWRSKEHFLSDITESPTKEARSWIPQVLKSAETLKSMGNSKPVSDSIRNITFNLQGRDDTFTVDEIEDIKS
jgi:hypothetical protein